ncbi:MAG: hypothetical protein LBH76_10320 [Propionibacteriaceae bacterium]|jgi:hypothetical protein|nr:hypothetical protein [Propionibacteriaceae bacterium]
MTDFVFPSTDSGSSSGKTATASPRNTVTASVWMAGSKDSDMVMTFR